MAIDIVEIAKRLHGRKSGSGWICRCPVHNDRSPSLSINCAPDGKLLVWCHAGCNPIDVLRAIGSRDDHCASTVGQLRPAASDCDILAHIQSTWQLCRPASGTPVEAYLRQRGYRHAIPATIRFHPALRHSPTKQHLAAMVAAITNAPDRKLTALHRTYLMPDGLCKSHARPNRMMLGRVGGGAVRLAPANTTMAIAEGIETALSVQQATGIATWAALSAGGLEKLILPPLPLASKITIAADHDAGGTGLRAAQTAAERWAGEGRSVRIAMPTVQGQDFNDVLLQGAP